MFDLPRKTITPSVPFSFEMLTLLILLLFPLVFFVVRKYCLRKFKSGKNVCVLVLGDIGRSPRMQYHAVSFAREGFTVDIIGYPGSPPIREISENARVRVHYLRPPPELRDRLPRLLCYVIKVVWQTVDLSWMLLRKHMSDLLITQNPPAIPTIPVCWLYCALIEAQFMIDWHNYAHSIMALSLGENHILVILAKIIETTFGYRAKHNFCVTKAMKEDLEKRWDIRAKVLYDRPTDKFHPITLAERNEFLRKLVEKYNISIPSKGTKRSGLIVSSTSWTEDEDFSILLCALQEYEDACEDGELNLPDLVCVITGKGPLKDFYKAIINLKKWKHVEVKTPWLENEDYPKILASADLGVCLHISSSGLDLPMKVVDMFGCRLPVCAYNFNCLSELVRHNDNSLVFTNEKDLAEQLKMWFRDFPNNETQRQLYEKFQGNMFTSQQNDNDWHSNWKLNVLPYCQE
ncbi:chitobiosyldiphosphodolichol beta-mannosyltransferase [Solenopsis invicta]|uniref:chitobiosyldiphosphodolichol beta-mannosyltransferase n=1 Tax=Solenopsis invicta TaxID=13686 RepID=UPI00193CCF2D|nr:chitobiosyldiphosphodolichol beta-mannosyltransferase [Solenopsis invicta]